MDTEISREDLARVLYYTPRIHKLDLSASAVTHLLRGFDRISDQTYDQLLAAFNKFTSPHTPFLPTLSELVVPFYHLKPENRIIGLVWGPRISKLSVRGQFIRGGINETDSLWQNVTRLVKDSENRLTHFDVVIRGSFREPLYWTAQSYTIVLQTLKTSAPKLTHLNVESFPLSDIDLIACLGALPSLEVLTMNIAVEQITFNSNTDLRGLFSGLKAATFIVRAPDVISNLVQVWNATGLKSLTIIRRDRSHFWFTDRIFQHLGRHLPARSFRSLILCYTVDDIPSDFKLQTSNTTSSTFEMLAPLSGLEELLINLGGRVILDDTNLLSVAKAFPNLHKFELYEREGSIPSTISPQGVLAFTAALPRLQDLVLRFNGTGNFPETLDIICHQLVTWDVCTSDASHVERLCSFIAHAFPRLRKLAWGWNYAHPIFVDNINIVYETDADETRAEQNLACWNDIFKRLKIGSSFNEGA